ncbi:Protein of unknown function [Cotesia congregata]|uniref:Uncharacterized protein n=1 Tax=Cotesia congregata TaxID=51543 RepID=A0A8J2MFR7_COTCN|nr:Protein of unknown function [Cotesia congregata]
MAAETSNMFSSKTIPKIRSKDINVTVVEEFLNQPDNKVNMIVSDLDLPFSNYTTLLCMAVQNSDEELIDYLIHRKADVNYNSPYGNQSPLFTAVVKGNTKLFKKLYHLGANIDLSSPKDSLM